MRYCLALIFSILAGTVAQLLMKSGVRTLDTITLNAQLTAGIAFYCAALFSWIIALRRFQLSFAYPLLSIGYLMVYIGAVFWPGLEEKLSWGKTMGVCIVILGITITAQDSSKMSRVEYDK